MSAHAQPEPQPEPHHEQAGHREVYLHAVSSAVADRRSILEQGGMHSGPLLEDTGPNAIALTTRCVYCCNILTQGVPLSTVALMALRCPTCDTLNAAEEAIA